MSHTNLSADQCEVQIGKSVDLASESDQSCMVMNNQETVLSSKSDSMDIAAVEEDLPATMSNGPDDMASQQHVLDAANRQTMFLISLLYCITNIQKMFLLECTIAF